MAEHPSYLTAFDLGMDQEAIKRSIANHIEYTRVKDEYTVRPLDVYWAAARAARDRLVDRWNKTQQSHYHRRAKWVYYLSLEFLMGRMLENSLRSLGMLETTRSALRDLGYELDDILTQEFDPGLGNGGLGRLAACFLDSMATLGLAAMGYGIRYEYGIFRQQVVDGRQVERADNWLRYGSPWEVDHPERLFPVKFGGRVHRYSGIDGRQRHEWQDADLVMAMATDILVPGCQNDVVNTLRLWVAKAAREFKFADFNRGDYIQSIEDKNATENISRVLYPNDMVIQGRELRLKQEYFFVCATLQDALRRHLKIHDDLRSLPDHAVFQLNDTHPAIAVAELMRLLVDDHGFPWSDAWDITTRSFAYTNHTVMPEALEQWEVSLFERLLPRHLELMYEINWQYLEKIRALFPGDDGKVQRMSVFVEHPEKKARMANLALIGSFAVNGVSKLHTELVKSRLFPDFAALDPGKFSAKTNGITPRRWLMQANPGLSALISTHIGDGWRRRLSELERLTPLAAQGAFRSEWREVKRENKLRVAKFLHQQHGFALNPDSLLDVQIKRIHEYKRQLLNVLQVIAMYHAATNGERVDPPRTFVFGGKAAPGYHAAKLIIELVNGVAKVINDDPAVADRLKVFFVPDYGVTVAELLIPAADVSEQISMAGTEASGTSNMKFALNGALTLGTLDGANIEIMEAVGSENVFIFGLTAEEVVAAKERGYRPRALYEADAELRAVLDAVAGGRFSPHARDHFRPLVESLLERDEYMVLADFQSYRRTQRAVGAAYLDSESWTRRSILNTAHMGSFSSDAVIAEYARNIWHTEIPKP